MNIPRAIIGSTQVNGFFSVSDGDLYMLDGQLCVIKSGSGWTLYPAKSDGSSFGFRPIEGWANLDGQMAVVQKINQAWAENN